MHLNVLVYRCSPEWGKYMNQASQNGSILMARLLSIALLLLMTTCSFGQATARATISATIETPVGAAKIDDPGYRSFPISENGRSTGFDPMHVKLVPGTVNNRTTTDTLKLVSLNIISNNYTYGIIIPSSVIVFRRTHGVETMSVDAFTLNSPSADPTQVLAIGAILNMDALQVAGQYVSTTPFTVMVNYN
jgi:hypothetical protein